MCGKDPTDCVDFLIPEELPDFVNEYEDTAMCLGDWMIVGCSWNDEIDNWYTMSFWTVQRVQDTKPIAL